MNDPRAALKSRLLGYPAVALLGSLTLLAACGATSSSKSSGADGGTGGSTVRGDTGGVGAMGGTTISDPPLCASGIPPTTQIPRLLNRQYSNVVRDLLGVTEVDGTSVADLLVSDFAGAMTTAAWQSYQTVGAKIAALVMAGPNKSQFIGCDPAATGCLQQTIQTFGRKAFRRPLSESEVARFAALSDVTPAGTPDEVAEAILYAFLVSPSFLLLPELNTETEDSAIKLSPQELATRLSFLIWSSIPDQELNDAADANQLNTKDEVLAQARRMIQVRPKTGPVVSAFHDEWSQMNSVASHWFQLDHDPAKYPAYDPAAKASYKRELDAFFEEIAFTGGSFPDLLLSKLAFVNKDNAAIYGLDPTQYTAELTKVTLDSTEQPRPGFLTRAGFLSSYSSYDATNPALRGAFIAQWMLNVNVGAPIPGSRDAKADGNFPTQRAWFEALTETNQPCKGCHTVINPLGFVLENYDSIGQWQVQDPRGGAIDSSVTTATIDFGQGETKEVSSPLQLMQTIARRPSAQEQYARAWVSYAFGRSPNPNDECVVQELNLKLSGGGYTILDLLADLTQAPSFSRRVAGSP